MLEHFNEYVSEYFSFIESIKGLPNDLYRNVSLAVELFNARFKRKLVSGDQSDTNILGRVKKDSNYSSSFYNYYVKVVGNLLQYTEWYNLYRLNFIDTMKLEYSTYTYLKDMLDKYEKSTRDHKQKLEDQLSNLSDE